MWQKLLATKHHGHADCKNCEMSEMHFLTHFLSVAGQARKIQSLLQTVHPDTFSLLRVAVISEKNVLMINIY